MRKIFTYLWLNHNLSLMSLKCFSLHSHLRRSIFHQTECAIYSSRFNNFMFFFVLFIVYSNFAIANKRKEIMEYAIIAAGEGSRLAHEGVGLPKPLVKVHGEALIDRLIRIFMDNGASAIHVICNDLTTQVSEHLSILKSEGLNGRELPLDFTIKTTPSSMHSFYELSKHLGNGPFILTTVDTIFREEEFSDYVRTFQQSTADGYDGLMGVTDYIDDEKPLYVGTDAAMNITGFYDKPQGDNQNDGAKYISGGIYGLTHQSISTLNHCMAKGMSRMRNFQRSLVADNLRLRAWPFSKVLDIDHKTDIAKAEAFLGK